CLIEGEAIARQELKEKLEALGNSLIVAGSNTKVRVHVHTNDPEAVFDIARDYGQVSKKKFDDMRKQHSAAYGNGQAAQIALITDSSCDLTAEFIIRHQVQMVPLQVSFGNDNFVDKITLTPKEFYRMLKQSAHHPKTSQPSPGDFLNTYKQVLGHYQQAISITVAGALSGTLQAAQSAAEKGGRGAIRVVDSRNTSVALGLIVKEVADAIEEGCTLDEVVARAQWAVEHVRFFIGVDTMDYLIRSGRVSKARGYLAKTVNVMPILTLDAEGRVDVVAKAMGGKSAMKKVMELVLEAAKQKKQLKFAVGHANAPETADWFLGQIKKQFEVRDVMVVNVSPALGAHVGPGAYGIAFLGE
ncbi:MAG: DegV family protein, partial [bacterium]